MKKPKKIIGIACIVVGAFLLLFSHYIAEQVASGREQIQSGQRQLNAVDKYFSQTPYSKELGKTLTSPYQKRINEGEQEVSYYDALSHKLQIGGVILILIGIAVLVFWKK